jgi:hypothetical protein
LLVGEHVARRRATAIPDRLASSRNSWRVVVDRLVMRRLLSLYVGEPKV